MFFDKTTAVQRSLLTQKIRNFFTDNDFLEVETPIMTPIPGMEPYLTPFETTLTPLGSCENQGRRLPGETFQANPPASPSPNTTILASTTNCTIPLYLNTSPELQMKKLLGACLPDRQTRLPDGMARLPDGMARLPDGMARLPDGMARLPDGSSAGFDKIFNITKVFRNGEIGGPLHNPEFTMLEWYRKDADYKNLMNDCENLILALALIYRLKSPACDEEEDKKHHCQPTTANSHATSTSLTYQSHTVNLTPPWPRFTTNELFIKYCGIDLLENRDFTTFKKTIDDLFPYDSSGCHTWDDLYFKIFLNHIEPELTKLNTPIFIYDYPASQAALAKTCSQSPFFAERFELYIKGIELANAFSELTDSKEQRIRLIEEQNLRKSLGKTVFPIDEEFLQALDHINAPAAGIALGLDRLIMLLLDKKSIEEVLLFPMSNMMN